MTFPERIANSPTPGTREAIGTLAKELTNKTIGEGETKFKLSAKLPKPLRKTTGQFRVVIGSEIIIAECGEGEEFTLVERAAEESTKAAHAEGVSVFHILTAATLEQNPAGQLTMATAYQKEKQKVKKETWTLIECKTVIKDPGANMKTGAGEGFYVAPAEGHYQVSAMVQLKTAAEAATIAAAAYVNGVEKARLTQQTLTWTTSSAGLSGAGIISAKSGDKIELKLYHSFAAEKELETGEGAEQEVHNRLSVVRVA